MMLLNQSSHRGVTTMTNGQHEFVQNSGNSISKKATIDFGSYSITTDQNQLKSNKLSKNVEVIERLNFFQYTIQSDSASLQQLNGKQIATINSMISDSLPGVTLNKAVLTQTKDGKLSFSYFPNPESNEETIIFQNEQLMNSWLGEKALVDVWEIENQENGSTSYKLQKINAFGYDKCDTQQDFYNCLTNDYGDLWKLENVGEGKTVYMQTKNGWFSRYHQEVDFEKLVYVTNKMRLDSLEEESLGMTSRKLAEGISHSSWWKTAKAALLTGLAGSAGIFGVRAWQNESSSTSLVSFDGQATSFMSNVAMAYGLSMVSGCHDSANRNAVLTGLGSLFSLVQGQNSPPVVANPIPDQMINVGQMLNFTINPNAVFSDPNADELTISATSNNGAVLPDWLRFTQLASAPAPALASSFASGINDIGLPLGVYVSDNYAYAPASFFIDLQIIDISNPNTPIIAGVYSTNNIVIDVYVRGNHAFVANQVDGLLVIDISDPANPTFVGSYNTPDEAVDVYVSGDHAFVADRGSGLQIIDISNPNAPTLASSFSTPGSAEGVFVSGNYAFIADGFSGGVEIVDVSNPAAPFLANSFGSVNGAEDIFVSGSYAFVAAGSGGLITIDISSPTNPILAGSFNTPGFAFGVFVSGDYAYVADNNSGLQIIDISDPTNPIFASNFVTTGNARGVYTRDNYAYVVDGNGAFHIISIFAGEGVLSGIPLTGDQGSHSIMISANDGMGGIGTDVFNITVANQSPLLQNPIPLQNATVGSLFTYTIPINTYLDPDNDVFTYSARFTGGSTLPDWLFLGGGSFSGIPTATDIGRASIDLTASDPYGGNVTEPFEINVVNGSQSANSTQTLLAPLLGTLGAVCAVGTVASALLCAAWRKNSQKARKLEEEAGILYLEPIRITKRMKERTKIGNKYYQVTNVNRQEAKEIYSQTGLYISLKNEEKEKKVILGKGNFGAIKVAFREEKGDFVASKKVIGEYNMAKSSEEADMQRTAAGLHVLPIYHSIKLEGSLYHFMPLAGYGNGRDVQILLKQKENNGFKNEILTHVAKDILTGLQACHSKCVYHLDIKPENIVLTKDGNAHVTDFGCAKIIKNENSTTSFEAIGDTRYFSPERLDAWDKKSDFRADMADAWATGFLLLELATGPDTFLNLQEKLEEISALKDAKKGSIVDVIKGLLNPDPSQRLSVQNALKANCFNETLSKEAKQKAFDELKNERLVDTESVNIDLQQVQSEESMSKGLTPVRFDDSYPIPYFPNESNYLKYDHEEHQQFYNVVPEEVSYAH